MIQFIVRYIYILEKMYKNIIQSKKLYQEPLEPRHILIECSWVGTEFLIPAIKILESFKMSFSYFIFGSTLECLRIFFPEICLWLWSCDQSVSISWFQWLQWRWVWWPHLRFSLPCLLLPSLRALGVKNRAPSSSSQTSIKAPLTGCSIVHQIKGRTFSSFRLGW